MKRINISVIPPVLLPSNLLHIGTEYKVSKDVLFIEDELLVNEVSETNLFEKKFSLDIGNEDTFYVVTRYKYLVLDETGNPKLENGEMVYKFGTPSMITPFKGNQEGVRISDTIIKTPKVRIETTTELSNKEQLVITTSEFEMFSSIGQHKYSTYVITDLEGKVLFKRELDEDNLTRLILPKEINILDNLIIYASHHSDTNATSNYGTYVNMTTNKLPRYLVEMYGELWVGVDAQFSIKLINALYTNCKLDVYAENVLKSTYNNIRDFAFIPTSDYIENKVYNFKFTITSTNGLEYEYTISKIARKYKERFKEKDYLDKYDYSGMIITNGLTKTLSYQLINNAILLFKNNTKFLSLAKYLNIRENNNLQVMGDLFALPVTNNIIDPSTFIKELLNGDVIISYISRDNSSFGNVIVNTYEHNFFNNAFRLKETITLENKDELVMPGSMVTSGNYVYYIKYNSLLGNKLVRLDPYNGITEEYELPYSSKYGISIVADLDNNIYLMGGTNEDITNFALKHKRANDNVYRFSTIGKVFTKVGNNLLSTVNKEIYQFHIAPRYGDGKSTVLGFTLFNTIENNNHDVIADQSAYVFDLSKLTITYKDNDHLDNLPYGNTIVMNNGDVIRYSSTDDPAQKVYTYISDSKKEEELDDDGNIIRDGNHLVVKSPTTVTKFDLCRYDSVVIEPGGTLIITGGEEDEICYSDTLVVTRDMVLDVAVEYNPKGYSNIVMACPEAKLVFK